MIVRIENTKAVEKLFDGCQDTMVWSCLQNIMGAVYADRLESPRSAKASLGDLCFFAGQPNQELILQKTSGHGNGFRIMVPQNEAWADLIEGSYGDRAKKFTRHAMRKDPQCFDRDALLAAVRSVEPGYVLKMIDEELYGLCRSGDWSRDFVSQYGDYARYKRLGIGVVVLKEGQLVAGASSYSSYRGGIEIQIDTREDYRRRGLATACGAKLILECLSRGLYPNWDAHTEVSVALAKKLGYQYDHPYCAYEIEGY